MKTSRITEIVPNGTYKELFAFEYHFENGDSVNFNHKEKEPKYKVGDEANYKIDYEKDGWMKGSFIHPQKEYTPKPSGDNLKGIKIGHAITNAVHLHISNGSAGESMGIKDSIKEYSKLIYQISEELNNEL